MTTEVILTDWMQDYQVKGKTLGKDTQGEDAIIEQALSILQGRMREPLSEPIVSPQAALDYLRLQLMDKDYQAFSALFLDSQNRVVKYREMFQGTLDSVKVHPRELVRESIEHNAAGIIFASSQPSGIVEPSEANQRQILRLKETMAIIDVRVLDCFLISRAAVCSFAERGLF